MIGQKIKEVRNLLGLSQKQLAGDEMTRAYISIIEQGHATPSEKALRTIALKLGKPIEYFLGEDDDELEICDAILVRAIERKKQGDLESALKMVNKVFAMTQNNPLLAKAYLISIEIRIKLNLYEEALVKGEEALFILQKIKDREYLVKFYLYMGKAAFKIENYPFAKKYYILAVKYSDQLKKLQIEKIQALMYLGTTNLRLGNIMDAQKSYIQAEKEVTLTDKLSLKADISLGLGKAYFLNNMIDEGIQWTIKAIEFYDRSKNTDKKIFAIQNLDIMKEYIGHQDNILELLNKCFNIYKEKRQYKKQAAVLEEIALFYLKMEKFEIAKHYCNESIKLLDKEENGILRARLYRLIGVIIQSENKTDESYYFLRMSYDLLNRIKSKDEAAISLQLLKEHRKQNLKKLFLKTYKYY